MSHVEVFMPLLSVLPFKSQVIAVYLKKLPAHRFDSPSTLRQKR